MKCTDPQKMLEFLQSKSSERKRRLFAVECCCRVIRGGTRPAGTFLLTAEKWVHGQADSVELRQALDASQVPLLLSLSMTDGNNTELAGWAVQEAILFAYE